MPDQAEHLRQLVTVAVPPANVAGPPMIVVTGGQGGVGATTVAMNLAAAIADRGERVVLVDAARHHANLTQLVGICPSNDSTLGDVLSGKIAAADALVPGPSGSMLLAGHSASGSRPDFSRLAQQRLLVQLRAMKDIADLLIVDTGSGLSPWTQRFWQRSRLVIVVTTSDDIAVMDTYAAIKLGIPDQVDADIRLLVNRSESDRLTARVEHRLETACQRFLRRTVSALPSLPAQGTTRERGFDQRPPRVWESPDSPFGHATLWLGQAVSDLLDTGATRPSHEGTKSIQPAVMIAE
ncbi:MAG: AAA family ATPase [Planctomycetes bacterium]|nr:AAA family ATPase [Planctomycetota bacterium]